MITFLLFPEAHIYSHALARRASPQGDAEDAGGVRCGGVHRAAPHARSGGEDQNIQHQTGEGELFTSAFGRRLQKNPTKLLICRS